MPNLKFVASTIPDTWRGYPNSKSRSRDPFTTPFHLILHLFDNVLCNQSFCQIWRWYLHQWPIWLFYYFADLAAKCLFPPILRRFFVFYTLNVVGYSWDPKRHILGPKHAFWRIDCADQSRNDCIFGLYGAIQMLLLFNATWARAEESKKERKKNRNWDVTSRIFAQTTNLALPHQSCHVGWGPGHRQPCQVLSKSVHGFWLPEGSKSTIFQCLAYITGLGYRPTCDKFIATDFSWSDLHQKETSVSSDSFTVTIIT